MFLESRRTDTEGFPTGKLSILLRNSCVVLHEMIFFQEINFLHHFRINTKPVLHEIAHSFKINKFRIQIIFMN